MSTPRLRRRGTSFAASTPLYRDVSATPGATPHKSNPMAPADDAESLADKKPTYEKHLSLDAFQAKYTSEDNASFNDLLDKQNEKKRNAYAFLWAGNRIPGFRAKAEQKRIADKAAADEALGGPRKSITMADDRKPVPNTWKAEPRNTLMFAPDGSPPPQAPPKAGDKELPPKSVVYGNTRMPPPRLPPPPSSPSFSTVRDAIAGNPRRLLSESGTGAETPRVNGYSFVADAPSPSPSDLGAPPLTWGSIAAIAPTDPAPTPFKLAPTPRRELLHHRMVDRVAKNKRVSNPLVGARVATPKMTPLGGGGRGREIPKFGSTPVTLTPAGQRLWSNLAAGEGRGVFGGREGAEGAGRMRWMPTPRAAPGERK